MVRVSSWFLVFNGKMKVVCGALREVRPTLGKGMLEGPLGML